MNCQQIDEHLFAYCDGTIPPDLRSLVDEHLAGCEVCQNLVQITLMESQLLAEAVDIPLLSEGFTDRVMQSVAGKLSTPAGSSSPGWLGRLGPYRFYIGGTAAAAVILLALYLPGLITLNTDMQSTSIADRALSSDSAADIMPESNTGNPVKSFSGSSSMAQRSIDDDLEDSAALPAGNTEEVEENLVPAADSSQYKISESVKREYGLSLLAGSGYADQDLDKSEFDLLSLHPNNLPAEYKIEKIINTNYNVVTYIYMNTVNNESLEITIALADDAVITQQSLPDGLGGSTDKEYLRSEVAPLNSTNTSVSYQGRSFEINLKAVMPLEKLQELADSIKFEEGLPDEPID
ncbi:hypothetical protein ASZ90_018151 [hydrocarbon metagenome]|uniref:Putative zinc-finger domain-containing protein n=1 Tax=hydrocarbon metagenome TaxID=938273 RepID=A0A0W8E7J7_9ZZZZ